MVAGVFFTRNRGLRACVGMEWALHESEKGMRFSGLAEYRHRELGDDLKRTALWPKNRWQRASFGIELAW